MPGNFLIDPVDFMRKNLVTPSHQNLGETQGDAGVHTVCLYKMQTPAKQLGKDIDKWVLMKHRNGLDVARVGGVFQAYWCPYAQNQTFTCMLHTESRYMFTATMDGCSFGIGSQAGDGACLVGHANAGRFGASREATYGMDGARQLQRGEQSNQLAYAFGNQNIHQIISPLDYMADLDGTLILKSTTFGYRNGMTWEFYTQKYWVNGQTYFMREVVRQ